MRVLATSIACWSHAHRVLSVASAIRSEGHDVLFAGSPWFEDDARRLALDFARCGATMFPATGISMRDGHAARRQESLERSTLDFFEGLRKIAANYQPDLIARDYSERGSLLLANELDIPSVAVSCTATSARLHNMTDTHWLNRIRTTVGLRLMASSEEQAPWMNICFRPREFHGRDEQLMPSARFVRHINARRDRQDLTNYLAMINPSKPLVVVALGRVVPVEHPDFVRHVLEELDCDLFNVLALGIDDVGNRTRHVKTIGHAPQQELLRHADVVVTHGGMNTVIESLAEAIPLVVVPVCNDEFYVADRCEQLAVGRSIDIEYTPSRMTGAVREATLEVLSNDGYGERAQLLRAANDAAPELASVVTTMLAEV